MFCVYNLARGVFLSSKVTVAENAHQPLKMLNTMVSGFALQGDSGLWLTPLIGPPAVPRLFPFDLVYLDKDHRILDAVELLAGVAFPPYTDAVSSALVLPLHTMQNTRTGPGDRLIICVESEMDRLLGAIGVAAGGTAGKISQQTHVLTRPPSPGPVAPSTGFSWIKFSDQAVVPASVPIEKSTVSQAKDVQIAKTPDQNAGSGRAKVKAAADQDKTPEEMKPTAAQLKTRGAVNGKQGQVANPGQKGNDKEERQGGMKQDKSEAGPVKNVLPRVSITEVVVEGPKDKLPQKTAGPEDAADLFANWVVSPSIAPEWIEQKTDPFIKREQASSKKAVPEVVAKPAEVPASKADSKQTGIRQAATEAQKPKLAVAPTAAGDGGGKAPAKSVEEPASAASTPKNGKTGERQANPNEVAPKSAAGPGKITIRAASQTTSFTVAQYGMWRVSPPTAAVPAVTGASREDAGKASARSELNEPSKPESGGMILSDAKLKPAVPDNKEVVAQDASPEAASIRQALRTIPSAAPAAKKQVPEVRGSSVSAGAAEAAIQRTPTQSVMPAAGDGNAIVPERSATVGQALKQPPGGGEQAIRPEKTSVTPAPESVASAPKPAAGSGQPLQRSAPVPPTEKNGLSVKTGGAKTGSEFPVKLPRLPNAEASAPSLATRLKRWLNPVAAPSDRRRALRRYVPGLVAHYYTGGAPKPHEIADISLTGFYILTDDRWMPETMIQMTLQKPCPKGDRKQSITVLSRIVRRGSDGVAAEFVMPETLDHYGHDVHPSQTTDKFALARFL